MQCCYQSWTVFKHTLNTNTNSNKYNTHIHVRVIIITKADVNVLVINFNISMLVMAIILRGHTHTHTRHSLHQCQHTHTHTHTQNGTQLCDYNCYAVAHLNNNSINSTTSIKLPNGTNVAIAIKLYHEGIFQGTRSTSYS